MATPKVEGRPKGLAVCEGYPNQLSLNLEELRQSDVLCDVTINIGGQSLRAHRTVLAASSNYFMGMFTRGKWGWNLSKEMEEGSFKGRGFVLRDIPPVLEDSRSC